MKRFLPALFFLFILPLISAQPSWLRPGVYFTYNAWDPETGSNLAYVCNGTTFFINKIDNLTVNLSIVDVSGNTARVAVRVTMVPLKPNEQLNRRGGIDITYTGNTTCNFWGSGEAESAEVYMNDTNATITVTTVVVYHSISINGTYLINLSNGSVYDLDGKYFGHTALWGLAGLKPGDPFEVVNGTLITVKENLKTNNDVITYWRTFQRPNGMLITNWSTLNFGFYETGGSDIFYYNPTLNLLEVMFGSPPDLRAIGIIALTPSDINAQNYAMLHKKELMEGSPRVIRPMGLSLMESNVEIGTIQINGEPPKSALTWVFLASMVLPPIGYIKRRR